MMTILVRKITPEESAVLQQWQRCDDIVRYRRARMLFLSEQGWRCPGIAEALGLHAATVREIITRFNEGGIEAITPNPRSGGRPRKYGDDVVQALEDLLRTSPSAKEGRSSHTLESLGRAVADLLGLPKPLHGETVRRLLKPLGVVYYKAKSWLTSPDPLYALHKRQRDRLLSRARSAPDGSAVWLDQSWFVRWPYGYHAWTTQDKKPKLAQRWKEKVETQALYAAIDDETQEPLLHWCDGQPNSKRTIRFLQKLMTEHTRRGDRYLVLFWDRAPWHSSRRTRQWIRAYNSRAKRRRLTRLLVCPLPTRSPWLMPLEPIFGWIKHHVLGKRDYETMADLRRAVENGFLMRIPQAKKRRDRSWNASLVHQMSTSVL
jgi:transposase